MSTSSVKVLSNGRQQFVSVVESVVHVEFLWNPASVNSNGYISESITVPGVKLGDIALITYEGDTQNLIVSACIHAADTVHVHMFNPTAGAVNLAEAQANILVFQTPHRHQ